MFWKHVWAFAHEGPGCGPFRHHGPWHGGLDAGPTHCHSRGGGPAFGARRPLRFMARELGLSDEQVAGLAVILDDLKTERAQAEVDHRKAVAAFADAMLGDSFDAEAVNEATRQRAESAARVEQAVARAIEKTYSLLEPEQRKKLAYLLRTGGLTI